MGQIAFPEFTKALCNNSQYSCPNYYCSLHKKVKVNHEPWAVVFLKKVSSLKPSWGALKYSIIDTVVFCKMGRLASHF